VIKFDIYKYVNQKISKILLSNYRVCQQVEEVRAKKGFATLRDMILAGETWTVK
jgi:hypothetical protein